MFDCWQVPVLLNHGSCHRDTGRRWRPCRRRFCYPSSPSLCTPPLPKNNNIRVQMWKDKYGTAHIRHTCYVCEWFSVLGTRQELAHQQAIAFIARKPLIAEEPIVLHLFVARDYKIMLKHEMGSESKIGNCCHKPKDSSTSSRVLDLRRPISPPRMLLLRERALVGRRRCRGLSRPLAVLTLIRPSSSSLQSSC